MLNETFSVIFKHCVNKAIDKKKYDLYVTILQGAMTNKHDEKISFCLISAFASSKLKCLTFDASLLGFAMLQFSV